MNRRRRWCFSTKALLDQFEEGTVATHIGQQLGVARSRIQRWRDHETFLDPYNADHYAIKLGKHPSQIWTNWFDLPEYSPKQQQEILQCQQTNATANVTTSSAKSIAAGAPTSRPSTSTSSSSNTTGRKSKPSSNTATSTAKSAKTRASKQSPI